MTRNPLAIAHACLQAYVARDRVAMEALLHQDFHFTSPIDNALDRATYMKVCWPNSEDIARFDHICEFENGNLACIVYELHTTGGKHLRNCEMYVVRDGLLLAT